MCKVHDVRTCKFCGVEFNRTSDGPQLYCKPECRKLANKEKDIALIKKWQDSNPESRMVSWTLQRAKRKGLEHNITKEDIVIPEFCPVFGFKLQRKIGSGHGGRFDSPSLDRIDPSKGYVKGNVMVISQLANSMKSDASPEQLLQFAKWVIETFGGENNE